MAIEKETCANCGKLKLVHKNKGYHLFCPTPTEFKPTIRSSDKGDNITNKLDDILKAIEDVLSKVEDVESKIGDLK